MFASIRSRMLLVTLLPLTVVIVALAAVFWGGRLGDLDEAHMQRARLIVRQVALSSEYGLFSGNTASLQGVLEGIAREPDVRAVAVFDANGARVAAAGVPLPQRLEGAIASGRLTLDASAMGEPPADVLSEPVLATRVALDDFFSPSATSATPASARLGDAVVVVSRAGLHEREHRSIELALAVGLLALAGGGLLAVRLGRTVVGPITRVSRMIRRIGQGDFAPDVAITQRDPLYDMQVALNHMAQRLGGGREDLERQVEAATLELRAKKEQAEEATLAKSRFLAAASHDLRQPTHALGMFIARLGQLPMDARMAELVRSLEASVQSMQDLLGSLLDLSRLESGVMPVTVQAVNLQQLLDAMQPGLQQMALEKGLRLRIRPTPLWAESDTALLQRIVLNLVHNAIRYTPHGAVLVACRTGGGGSQVRLEVWDSGMGIAETDQADIFKEFYQVARPGGARNQGMGLGLNIVERSAVLLGHSIALRSRPGRGTRFTVTMQRAQPVPQAERRAADHDTLLHHDLSGVRVLVVEDDASALEAVGGLLRSWGCVVQLAGNAGQALLRVVEQGTPQVVLSDLHLGNGLDGIALIERLRAASSQPIAACLMSGSTGADVMEAAQHAGLTLLHKPVRPAKLRNLLRRLTMD